MDQLRIAIAGAGTMAGHHATSITRLPGLARITAICDPHPEARTTLAALAPEAAQFDNLQDLLAGTDVDVVHIVTPPASHATLTELALRHGCHVYVEKPFVEDAETAARLLQLASQRGRLVCAGHQLLFERPSRAARELLPAIKDVRHVESYFSFRVVSRNPEGRAPLRPDEQLIDILPHPVYTLLDFLRLAGPGPTTLAGLSVGASGTLHALFQRGPATGVLVVTVEGRPVESYLRIVGTNGSVFADFVRSTVQRHLGPGSSGIDKLLAPYQLARQLVTTTTVSMARRFIGRQRSYPGLVELFGSFYEAIRQDGTSPVAPETILETVRVCEEISREFERVLATAPAGPPLLPDAPVVAVTGGTGFLGRAVAQSLGKHGYRVRALARRLPAAWDRVPGVDYHVADLASPLAPEVLQGCQAVIHCAAETAGGYAAHQANSIDAAEHVLQAAAAAGVRKIVHLSSISVMAQPRFGKRVSESSPLEPQSRALGAYAWGKTESEVLVTRRAGELGLALRIVRPGAFVDYERFEPPGLLGKRVGNIFVAVGSPAEPLAVVDINFTAATLAWTVHQFDAAPPILNLMDPDRPTKGALVRRLRTTNPDLRVIWLPRLLLVPMSAFAMVLQKLLRPRKAAVNVAKTFARQRYSSELIQSLAPEIREFDRAATAWTAPETDLAGSGAHPGPAVIG